MHFVTQVVDTAIGVLIFVVCDYSQDVGGWIVSVIQPAHHTSYAHAVSTMQNCKFSLQMSYDSNHEG